jgi:hypothetical protein
VRKFLGFLIVVELIGAGVYFAGPSVDDWLQDRVNPTVQAGPTERTPPSTNVVEVLRPGQAEITGVVTSLVARDAASDPIPTPFTIEATERGVTRAVIEGVLVDRRPSTISWDGGRPLPITGAQGSGLDLGSANLTADASGYTWSLEGSPRGVLPGTYKCNFTVAVGSGGVASFRDNVAFTATAESVLDVTKGGAFLKLPPAPLKIQATQPTTAVIEGSLSVRTSAGTRPARAVQFGPGLYDITLTPGPSGLTVRAILQGPVEV